MPKTLIYDRLSLAVPKDGAWVEALSAVSFRVPRGRVVGLVGESGCGKSLTAQAALRLHEFSGVRHLGGDLRIDDRSIFAMREQELLQLRGGEIAMVFQEPMTALNPVFTIAAQMIEPIVRHLRISKAEAYMRARALLAEVGIDQPDAVLAAYPDALSGGMRQRVLIAMAIGCEPSFLIADEPTTALDVSVQKRIVALLRRLQRKHELGMLLVTHDFGLVAELADEVVVLYAGEVVEQAPVEAIFDDPLHPYTQALLACRPEAEGALAPIPGQAPLPGAWPEGCRFSDRCPKAQPQCRKRQALRTLADGRRVRCLLHETAEQADDAAA